MCWFNCTTVPSKGLRARPVASSSHRRSGVCDSLWISTISTTASVVRRSRLRSRSLAAMMASYSCPSVRPSQHKERSQGIGLCSQGLLHQFYQFILQNDGIDRFMLVVQFRLHACRNAKTRRAGSITRYEQRQGKETSVVPDINRQLGFIWASLIDAIRDTVQLLDEI